MMKNLILLILSTFTIGLFGQSNQNTNIDYTNKIKSYDIGSLFLESSIPEDYKDYTLGFVKPLGYFGNNYQRFHIHFLSVEKDQNQPNHYFVRGKSKLKNNVVPFAGKINIIKAEIFEHGEIDEFKQGYIKFEYTFDEEISQGGTGKFEGIGQSYFFINKDDNLFYDAITLAADGYENNKFQGFWISYKSGKKYKCNWGDFRIPDSQDLDQGAGEFGINPKYLNNGWKSYFEAYGYSNNVTPQQKKKALQIEQTKWWQ